MKSLKESIIDDLETTMAAGDKIINDRKNADKDFKKLFCKVTGKSTGQFYGVSIKSPELAAALAENHPAYQGYIKRYPNTIDDVTIIYDIDDVFAGKRYRHIQINVQTRARNPKWPLTIIASHLYYTDNEDIPNGQDKSEGIGIKEAVKILSAAVNKKYNNLDDLIKAFNDNVKYTAKI